MDKLTIISVVTLFVALSSGAPSKKQIAIPDGCKNTPLCGIRPEGYDEIEDEINKLMSPYLTANVADRYGPPPTTQITETNIDNCPSVKSSVPYYIIRTSDDTKMDIIIQTRMLQQNVEVVRCAYDKISDRPQDRQCFEGLGLHEFNMKTSCQETLAIRSLLVYDPELGHIRQRNYTIPVCCSCKITNV